VALAIPDLVARGNTQIFRILSEYPGQNPAQLKNSTLQTEWDISRNPLYLREILGTSHSVYSDYSP